MLARVPWSPVLAIEKPKPQRINKDRKRDLVDRIAGIMREAEPTPFAAEGPARAGIRASLCLDGWPWATADKLAADVVGGALHVVGAVRPTWDQGQPGWTEPGALPVLRERCARCGHELPDGHRLWCSDVCAKAAKLDRQRQRWDEESYAAWKAYQAAWQARQPKQDCEGCGRSFRPKRKGQRFCRYECSVIDQRSAGHAPR